MPRKVVDLVALARPLPAVRFPNGSEHQLRAFDAAAWKVFREGQATPDVNVRNAKGVELLRMCAPTASDDDLTSLGAEDMGYIFATCARQVDGAAGQAAVRAAVDDVLRASLPNLAS
jgi:hypothetical protein